MKIHSVFYDAAKEEYKIRQFTDARRALDEMKEVCPLLIVCGVEAQENRLDLCCTIQGDPILKDIPLIIHIPEPDTGAQIRYRLAGADLVLSGPISTSQQRNILSNLMAHYDQFWYSFDYSLRICNGKIMQEEDRELINQVMDIILEHISDATLSPAFIADRLNIGLRTLYRRLKGMSDLTLTAIILHERLEFARQLLIRTHLSVKAICFKSGFSNHGTFYKQFTTKFSCTPRKYRILMSEQEKEMKKVQSLKE